jgi:hypothetical protein
MLINVIDSRGDLTMRSADVGAEVAYMVGAVDGVDVFIPKVGTSDGTELIEGDCVGGRVMGSGDRVKFDPEVDDGLNVEGTWIGVLVGATVPCEYIEPICSFHSSNHRVQHNCNLHHGEKNTRPKFRRSSVPVFWYLHELQN